MIDSFLTKFTWEEIAAKLEEEFKNKIKLSNKPMYKNNFLIGSLSSSLFSLEYL